MSRRRWQSSTKLDAMVEAETQLILIRHGESRAQSEHFLSGHSTCTGLSDVGRQQAMALRDRLLRTGELADTDVVFASILQRAVETAEIIAPAIGEIAPRQECDWC